MPHVATTIFSFSNASLNASPEVHYDPVCEYFRALSEFAYRTIGTLNAHKSSEEQPKLDATNSARTPMCALSRTAFSLFTYMPRKRSVASKTDIARTPRTMVQLGHACAPSNDQKNLAVHHTVTRTNSHRHAHAELV